MGIELKKAGIQSFTILEKADRVGGTWRDNIYPGVACDVPSHLYSYSFELNPDWSRAFSPGSEIQEYCERCAEKYELGPHLRFGQEVEHVDFDDERGRWRIRTSSGSELEVDVVVSALGGLHIPKLPEIRGMEDFAGVSFHSARWNTEHDLAGRKVAVIGSAASAIQIVPEIAPEVERLSVFQRTPNWIVPRNDRVYSEDAKQRFRRFSALTHLYRFTIWLLLESRFPAFRKRSFMSRFLERLVRKALEEQIADPELREQLTPDYPPGCKRMLLSDDFYSTLVRDNVDLVTSPIERIVPDGIVTADGQMIEADTIVFATGFQPFNFLTPLEVTGMGAQSLGKAWEQGVEAHRTVGVPGFPNFFMLLGPNSGLGHNSVIIMIEAQARYVRQCIRAIMDRGIQLLDPWPEASRRFNDGIQEDMQKTIWKAGCKSWYMDERGKVFALWPSTTIRYWWSMRRPRFSEYRQRVLRQLAE